MTAVTVTVTVAVSVRAGAVGDRVGEAVGAGEVGVRACRSTVPSPVMATVPLAAWVTAVMSAGVAVDVGVVGQDVDAVTRGVFGRGRACRRPRPGHR